MKNIKLSEKEVELLDRAIVNELKSLDKVISMLLKKEQVDAVKPVTAQIKLLQDIKDRMEL